MNNGSAIGYGLMALKELGFSKEDMKKFESEMYYQMDMKTEEEAESFYRKF